MPSTLHALLSRGDPLAATLAAGTIVLRDERSTGTLLLVAVPVHIGISLAWGALLALILPRRGTVAAGFGAGLAIAALDLGVVGRRFPQIRALPRLPQVADHLAFGGIVGAVVGRRRARREEARWQEQHRERVGKCP